MKPVPFNPQQQRIINKIDGALLVLAPVGTGKTSVLTQRVARAIERGVDASRILCLTFTNRAAKEMSERLTKIVPQHSRQIEIRTFHSLCAQLLRIEAQSIGLPADFVVYDDADCFEIVKKLSKLEKDKEVKSLMTEIANSKARANEDLLTLGLDLDAVFSNLVVGDRVIANKYQKELNQRHAIDFADLVFYTRAILTLDSAALCRWQDRFDFIQVDEVQDTHLTEYEVVRHLAIRHGQLALIGDLDQTIYEWRGSEPAVVLQQFMRDFAPEECSLTLNYRATKTLLHAASTFADSFEQRHTSIIPAMACLRGDDIYVHTACSDHLEATWIASQIRQLARTSDYRYDRTAVLTRTNKCAESVASVLVRSQIPCITVEQYDFFKRKEIKDAIAYLKFIANPFDTGAFQRLSCVPARGISVERLRTIYADSRSLVDRTPTDSLPTDVDTKQSGLRLVDFASTHLFLNNDPFELLSERYKNGTVVVFDVETTGVSISDDVVEIAAIKLVGGQPVEEFREYISDAASVGDSQHIHGYSDELLHREGKLARDVFSSFFQFASGALLVGHNVGFDITKVTAHSQKVGLSVPSWRWADTWNLAQRFIKADSYSLGNLVSLLRLPSTPNHQAMDDVRATVDLLTVLMPLLIGSAAARRKVVGRHRKIFEALSEKIIKWKNLSQSLRPAELLNRILSDSGLVNFYSKEADRLRNLERLMLLFQEWDDVELQPDTALRYVLERTALAKNLDQISKQDNQVVVTTAHQSKGLEFDNVFIAGTNDGEFPGYRSIEDDKLEEEKRTFYVAITRAKERLFVSCSTQSAWYGNKAPSRFLQSLPEQIIRRSSSPNEGAEAS